MDIKHAIEGFAKENPEFREEIRSLIKTADSISEDVMFGLIEGQLGVSGRRDYELIRIIRSLDI